MRLVAFYFVLGAASLVTQTLLIREFLVVVQGSELVLGLLFACWLGWIGVGAALGARAVARLAGRGPLIYGVALVAALLPLAELELVRQAPRLFDVGAGLVLSLAQVLVLALVALAPWALFIGASFPVGAYLLRGAGDGAVARLYGVEALGAVAGGVGFSFGLVGHVAPLAIVTLDAAVLVGAATLARRRRTAAGGLFALLLLVATPLMADLDRASQAAEVAALAPGQRFVTVLDTRYERVALTELAGQYALYGDGRLVASFPEPFELRALAYRLLAQQPEARRVLILGNAAAGLAQEMARALASRPGSTAEDAAVSFVDADRDLTAAIAAHLAAPDALALRQSVRVIVADPRAFLLATRERFDLVFVNQPMPTATYTNRFYTREAFRAAARVLVPSGVLAYRLTAASAYLGADTGGLAASVRLALAAVFAAVLEVPGDDLFYFASVSAATLARDAVSVEGRLSGFAEARPFVASIALDYRPERRSREEAVRRAAGDAEANTDDHPTSVSFGTALWERATGGRPNRDSLVGRLTKVARSAGRTSVAGLLALGVLSWWLVTWRLRRSARGRVLEAGLFVFILGFSAMATNLVLLMHYQSSCGALFERLAVMGALFMLGLAGGAAAGARVWRAAKGQLVLVALLGLVALSSGATALVLPALGGLGGVWSELAHAALFAFAGVALGVGFPRAALHGAGARPAETAATVELTNATGGTERTNRAGTTDAAALSRAAGVVDAADHMGAALAALLVGTCLLPALGASATVGFVAAVAVAGALCLLAPALFWTRGL